MSSDNGATDQFGAGRNGDSDVDPAPAESPAPSAVPRPKRGAFPTPQSEIDNAEPYVAQIDETDDRQEIASAPPADADNEKES